MKWENVKEKLEDEKEEGSSLPPFWDPVEGDSKLMGKVVEKRISNFDDDNFLYHVKNPETGETKTTPEHTALVGALKRKNVEVGDYVLIEYTGTEKAKSSGREVHLYDVGVVPADEAKDVEETPDRFDDDYDTIKEVIDFFGGDVDIDEFVDVCKTKGIDAPIEKEYVEVDDGKIKLVD